MFGVRFVGILLTFPSTLPQGFNRPVRSRATGPRSSDPPSFRCLHRYNRDVRPFFALTLEK